MNVYFVIGPACAGKSTYIKENFKDAIIVDLYDFQKDSFITVESIIESYNKCEEKLIEALKTGKDVVLEHTLLLRKRRPQYIKAVRDNCDCKLTCIVIKPSIEALMRQEEARYGCKIDVEHVEGTLNMLELPLEEDGFDEIKIIET